MNAFVEHHNNSIQFGYRCFDPSSTLFVAISPQVIGRVERYLDNRRCVVSYWRELVLLELVVSVD